MKSLITILVATFSGLSFTFAESQAAEQNRPSGPLILQKGQGSSGFKVVSRKTGQVVFEQLGIAAEQGAKTIQSRIPFNTHFESENIVSVEIDASGSSGGANGITVYLRDRKEHYYGIWEAIQSVHLGTLDNRGVRAEFLGMHTGPDGNYASARAPFYMSSLGYGIYVQTEARGSYVLGVSNQTSFTFKGDHLKYYFIYGPDYSDILQSYNQLAGPAVMPPLWAFDVGWWRDDEHVGYHGNVRNAEQNIFDDADHLEANHLPASYFWLDRPYGSGSNGWGNLDFDASFPQPKKMIQKLGERGYNVLLWIANKAWDPNELWLEALEKNYLFKVETGSSINLELPGASEWFRKKLEKFSDLGVKGYKIDRGEEDEDQVPEELKNSLHLKFAKLAKESLEKSHAGDAFIFTRNLNDVGRKFASVWSGDPLCTFGGLKTSIANGLRSGLMNFPMWGSDTGGLVCEAPTKELFARWFAFSALSPMMEITIGGTRTPWYDYDSELVAIAQKFTQLHHDLMPYTRSLLYQATQTGMPLMRPLIFSEPANPAVTDLADEYLFGGDLLVAPVVQAGASGRSVYFPRGRWLDANSGEVYEGGKRILVKAPLSTLPLYIREGAIIPRGDILKSNNSWTAKWSENLRLEFYPSLTKSSRFLYYNGFGTKTISASSYGSGIDILAEDLGTKAEMLIFISSFKKIVKDGKILQPEKDYHFDVSKRCLHLMVEGSTHLKFEGAKDLFRN